VERNPTYVLKYPPSGTVGSASSNNLAGAGDGLTDGVHSNKTGITNPNYLPLATTAALHSTIPSSGSITLT